jgi:hypothetical protein
MQPPFIAHRAAEGLREYGMPTDRDEKNQADRMLSEPTWFYAVLGVSLKSVSGGNTHEPPPGSRR